MKRSGIGAQKRARVQSEAAQARVLEGVFDKNGTCLRLGLFGLHHLDWLHIADARRSTGPLRRGMPDYLIVGKDFKAWIELKARNPVTGRPGVLSPEQRHFQDMLLINGDDVFNALLPDDLRALNEWLGAKTGILVATIDGLMS